MSEYIIDMGASIPNPNGGLLCANVSQLREEIVRCRDCDDFDPRDEECGGRNWCERMSFEVTHDGYCAWGERRNDG